MSATESVRVLTKSELARYVRARIASHLYYTTRDTARAAAIYTLSDPRDVADARYVGQTSAPRRRFLQHLAAARLWLPGETPWWIRSEKYRPLYAWVRDLFADDRRLPVMVVRCWVEDTRDARAAERALIRDCRIEHRALLNVENEASGPQIPLL